MTASAFSLLEVAIVVGVFMRIRNASPLMHVLVAGGVFWLIAMLGLGCWVPMTRVDLPVTATTSGR